MSTISLHHRSPPNTPPVRGKGSRNDCSVFAIAQLTGISLLAKTSLDRWVCAGEHTLSLSTLRLSSLKMLSPSIVWALVQFSHLRKIQRGLPATAPGTIVQTVRFLYRRFRGKSLLKAKDDSDCNFKKKNGSHL